MMIRYTLRRVLAATFAVALMLTALPAGVLTVSAATSYKEGNYTYTVTDGKATITECDSSISGDVTIPSTLRGYPVTTIGDEAFDECRSLTSITIPNSVTTIGDWAFAVCRSLTSITIPNSVTTIGDDAFFYCDSLTSITIPNSVTTIGNGVFNSCDSLTSIEVDAGNTVYHAKDNCLIETATDTLIQGCQTSVIPDYVTTIGYEAFCYCESLTSITIPNSVTTIGDRAFYWCTSLTSITIADSVTTIGDDAFNYCISLTSITIPNSVTTIGSEAFSSCDSLTSIEVDDGNTVYHAKGNCLIETATDTLIQGCQTSVIPDYVTTIGNGAFFWCKSLTSITIPNSVTAIGDEAFYYCRSLTSITIPNSVTTIGSEAFSSCDSLTDVWYIGADRSDITIGSDNDYLLNAAWHYVDTCPDAHQYTAMCDKICDVCDFERKAETDHIYDNACDIDCNECGDTRTVPDHVYDNACDIDCNECGDTRTVPDHVYDNACDIDCNECGDTRTVPDHVYDNACDADCNECGDTRTVPDHVYDNACDIDCNECGGTRTVPDHVYDNACDIDCNVCGDTRTVPDHMYDNAYDTVCNECNITRPQPPVIFSFTDSSVSLIAADGCEYSMDGETWQTDPVFTGLSPATTYAFYQRSAGTDRSAAAYVTTDKAEQAAVPAAPTVQSVTATTITLNIVDGCEYSMDGKRWQESPTFTDLTPATAYTFYQRYAETATHYVGRAGAKATFTTDKAMLLPPAAPTLAYKTANTIVLEAHSGYEYSIGGVEWQTSPVFTGLLPKTNYMVYQRLAETDDHYATAASSALIVKTEASPLLDGVPGADDVQFVWHSVVGLIPPLSAEEIAEADQNGDGIVNLHDAARLFYMVNGLI